MARSEARLHVDLWREGLDGLSAHAKLMYCVLLTEPTLNHAGVGAVRESRWARNASLTAGETGKALDELRDSGHVVIDEDTEEVLVRTLIRRDGVADQPYVLKGALKEAIAAKSPTIRWVLAEELRKLPPRRPDGVSKAGKTVVYPDPHAAADELAPTGCTPPPTPTREGSETLFEGFGEGIATHLPEKGLDTHSKGKGEGEGEGDISSPVGTHSSSATTRPSRTDVEELCKHLRDRIVGNGSKGPTASQANGWRSAARLMLDRDKRDVTEAHALIDWCQDDDFWRSNILGMPKFRKQYDTLRLRAQSGRHLAAVPPAAVLESYEDYLEHTAASEAARLLGIACILREQPPSDDTPRPEFIRSARVEWLEAHEDDIRAALTERKTG